MDGQFEVRNLGINGLYLSNLIPYYSSILTLQASKKYSSTVPKLNNRIPFQYLYSHQLGVSVPLVLCVLSFHHLWLCTTFSKPIKHINHSSCNISIHNENNNNGNNMFCCLTTCVRDLDINRTLPLSLSCFQAHTVSFVLTNV